ncbi:MAG: hypothetical protein ACW98Y_04745 [Candidatus Thorarchaeota archaeon]|jgi:hypothetical protein
MEESRLWTAVFVTVVLVGTTVIFANLLIPDGATFTTGVSFLLRDGTRLVSIFLGVLAGVSLGELFKIRSNNNTGKKLLADLIEELKVNSSLIEKGIPLRKGFWKLGIRSGRAEFLSQEDRRELWEIYSRITHYNEDLQYIHRSSMLEVEYKVPSELQKELDTFSEAIQKRVSEFLEKKSQ